MRIAQGNLQRSLELLFQLVKDRLTPVIRQVADVCYIPDSFRGRFLSDHHVGVNNVHQSDKGRGQWIQLAQDKGIKLTGRPLISEP